MNILTFDIEEWFHILDNESTNTEAQWEKFESRLDNNLERILDILEEKKIRATFFCLGWVARANPSAIRAIANAGHEIATHSDRHQLAYTQDIQEFRIDLQTSIKSIEDITGVRVRSYRAPGFSLTAENMWVFDVLIEEGIEIDCSIFPASRAHGGCPSFGNQGPTIVKCQSGTIKEFPINTYNILGRHIIFSGGGYFRLLPYQIIKYLTKNSKYIMTYFHPRDFDPGQPVISGLSMARRFKSYYGLSSAEKKLRKYIDDTKFICLDEADKSVDWDKAPVFQI